MAQPIKLHLPPRDPKRELAERLEQAPVEYAAAILDSFETLQKLHESGALVLVRGLLKGTDKIVDDLAAGAAMIETIQAMRNGMILAKMLGAIDPELLHGLTETISGALGSSKNIPEKPPGIFSLVFGFFNRDSRRGLAFTSELLRGIGRSLNPYNAVNTPR